MVVAEDFVATEGISTALEDVAWGICPEGFAIEKLGREGIELEEFGFKAGFFCMAFLGAALLAKASTTATA